MEPCSTLIVAGCTAIVGAIAVELTERVAGALVKLLTLFATVTVKFAPLSPLVVGGVVYDADVAPPMGRPFLFHWKVIGAVPTAFAVKVALVPDITLVSCGCAPISTGPTAVGVSVLRFAISPRVPWEKPLLVPATSTRGNAKSTPMVMNVFRRILFVVRGFLPHTTLGCN